MRLFLSLFFLNFTFFSFSQEAKTATLEVVGSARMSVTPDVGVLTITFKHVAMSFSESIRGLNRKTQDINEQLEKIGFKSEDIKTTNFDVNTNTVWRERERIDSGYVATQNVKVEFPNEGEIITKILQQFSASQTEFKLSFDFKLSEKTKEKVQNEIIKIASMDAFEKGKMLAKYSGAKISSLKKIVYGNSYSSGMSKAWETMVEYEVEPDLTQSSNIVGFTPSDIIFRDQVLVIWEIN